MLPKAIRSTSAAATSLMPALDATRCAPLVMSLRPACEVNDMSPLVPTASEAAVTLTAPEVSASDAENCVMAPVTFRL